MLFQPLGTRATPCPVPARFLPGSRRAPDRIRWYSAGSPDRKAVWSVLQVGLAKQNIFPIPGSLLTRFGWPVPCLAGMLRRNLDTHFPRRGIG